MRPSDLRICPQCGTQNKVKWEFCVRCGESLQGVAVGDSRKPASKPEAPVDDFPDRPWRSVVWTVLALGVAVALAVMYFVHPPPAQAPRPDPGTFGGLRVPSTPPPKTLPAREVPGQKEFEEGRAALLRGDTAHALELLAAAVSLDGGNPTYHSTYGQALSQAGREADASQEFGLAVQIEPADYG